MAQFSPGDVFADYRIEGLAGRGGMGVVYRATQLGLERTVALKVIRPSSPTTRTSAGGSSRESKAAASVDHPNVIPVYDAGEREGVLFIVMRLRRRAPTCGALIAREDSLDPSAPPGTSPRSPGRSTPPTAAASCTATSSRRTSCSTRTTMPT